jgi:uncharacterized repeat protein (TIGR04138 family)
MALKNIYSARNTLEANFLRELLEAKGIGAMVVGQSTTNAFGMVPIGKPTLPTVWINEDEIQRASEIIREFKTYAAGRLRPAAGKSWKCANCGESIKGQFTDCWKCLTPRPDTDEADTVSVGTSHPTLNFDLPCRSCGYNLRGLTGKHRCPECGLRIWRTLMRTINESLRFNSNELEMVLREPFEAITTDYSVNVPMLVCDGWMQVWEPLSDDVQDLEIERTSKPAKLVCRAVRELAIHYFSGPDQAKLGLQAWKIQNSDDIGRIVAALAENKLIDFSSEYKSDEFDGLCNLEQMFERDF